MSDTLGPLVVEVSAEGFQDLVDQLAELEEKLKKAGDASVSAGVKVTSLGDAADRAAGLLGAAQAQLLGFVQAGANASYVGDQVAFSMQRISLTIAGLFRPELEKIVAGLRRLDERLSSLSDAQRASVARWVEAAAAGLFFWSVLPRLIGGVQMLTAALGGGLVGLGPFAAMLLAAGAAAEVGRGGLGKLFEALRELGESVVRAAAAAARALAPLAEIAAKLVVPAINALTKVFDALSGTVAQTVVKWAALTAGFLFVINTGATLVTTIVTITKALRAMVAASVAAQAASGPKGWIMLATAATAAAAAMVALDKFMDRHDAAVPKEAPGARAPLAPRPGGFESLNASYERIALASLRATAGKSVEEEQLEEQRAMRGNIEEIRDEVLGLRPAWAPPR